MLLLLFSIIDCC